MGTRHANFGHLNCLRTSGVRINQAQNQSYWWICYAYDHVCIIRREFWSCWVNILLRTTFFSQTSNSRYFLSKKGLGRRKDSLPKHERPSPANPSLQVQLCPPTVLVQVAFTPQSWFPVMHSSTSTLQTIKIELFNWLLVLSKIHPNSKRSAGV